MAQKQYSIVKNLFYSSISTATTFFLFVLMSFVGRYLGVKEYGVFVLALDFAAIFEMFTDFGLRDISVRNVSQNQGLVEKYIGNLIAWKLVLSAAVYAVLAVVVNVMQYDSLTKTAVYILAPSSFMKNMKYTVRLFFQVRDRFGWDTVLVVLERTLLLGVGIAVLSFRRALIPFVIAFTAVRLADLLFTMAVLHRQIAPIRLKLDFPFIKKLQWEALPLGFYFVVFTVYSYIDTVMLSKMTGLKDVGQYNAAFKIYEGITIMPTIFWLVVLPRLSELYVTHRGGFERLAVRSIRAMFLVALPTMLCGIAAAHWMIGFFFNAKFLPAVFALQLLFLGILFQYPNWMLNTVLIAASRQKAILFLGLGGLAVKIILNIFLIPVYGFNGSALSTVFGEGTIFALTAFYIHRRLLEIHVVPLLLKSCLCMGLAWAGYRLGNFLTPAAGLLFAGLLFFAGLLITKLAGFREWGGYFSDMLNQIRSKKA
jgi:O-antigen/teichoic acid export membrane protein